MNSPADIGDITRRFADEYCASGDTFHGIHAGPVLRNEAIALWGAFWGDFDHLLSLPFIEMRQRRT